MADFAARFFLALAGAAFALPRVAAAETPPVNQDQGVASAAKPDEKPAPLPWHGSVFVWDHAVTTQTVGLGADYQSRNPTYEMTFRLAPRYYFIDNKSQSVSVRADARLMREFTNSDSTTERGEWTFLDSELWLAETQTLNAAPGRHSELVFRVPLLVFPTSKVSYKSGRLLGLGAGAGIDHQLPLRGESAELLPSLLLRARANYTYQFADAVVATGDIGDRFRLDGDSRAVRSDQLTGSMLPQHQLVLSLGVDTGITKRLTFSTEFGARYARRYALDDSTRVCGMPTGCVDVEARPDASRWSVITVFSAALSYAALDYLEISAGYGNQSRQLGADGRRRSIFYSPDAGAFLAFTVALDALYQTARGRTPGESEHTATALRTPAL